MWCSKRRFFPFSNITCPDDAEDLFTSPNSLEAEEMQQSHPTVIPPTSLNIQPQIEDTTATTEETTNDARVLDNVISYGEHKSVDQINDNFIDDQVAEPTEAQQYSSEPTESEQVVESYLSVFSVLNEPQSFKKAAYDPRWIEVMNQEIKALEENHIWEVVDLPEGKKPIGSKVIYMRKCNTLATRFPNPGENKVCILIKSLYGLKQDSRQWNIKLTDALVGAGYQQSAYDHSLFTKQLGQDIVIILVYVDDLLITGRNMSLVEDTKITLHAKFKVKGFRGT
uniref:Uncharacterized protein LOC104212263 n=1 Tax=Nicotiana sylvestris TaxID=4096 RepID=A0A1U7VBU4_NICSY|nr:PREDICTED: uncharacterized protein LOC104212263 [Nicotiana sylvestris]